MKIYDNTMISTYRRCPREYYFRHVRDWNSEGAALPLVFGLAWHEAMDVVWGLAQSDKRDDEILMLAGAAFVNCWTEQGMPSPDNMTLEQNEDWMPRTPGVAFDMLYNYIEQRRKFLRECEIIDIEKPFAVPLSTTSGEVFYVGRRDKVFKTKDGRILIGEHKTTSLYSIANGFRNEFLDSFSPNSQVDGYLHSGHMEYGDALKGVWIDAALVHKKVHDQFRFIPIDRITEMLDGWLVDTRAWIAAIEEDVERLENSRVGPGVPYMNAFRKNTDSCFRFNTACKYKDICRAWPNPDRGHDEVPPTFKLERWSPFDVLELSKIGMKEDSSDAS